MVQVKRDSLCVILAASLLVSGCTKQPTPRDSASNPVDSHKHDGFVGRAEVANIAKSEEVPAKPNSVDATAAEPRLDTGTSKETRKDVVAKANGKATTTEPQVESKPPTQVEQVVDNAPVELREARYVPLDCPGLFVASPKRFLQSPMGKPIVESDLITEVPVFGEFLRRTQLKPTDVDRMTLVIDPPVFDAVLGATGVIGANSFSASSGMLKASLKDIALAFQKYQLSMNRYPRANGDGNGKLTGLSWRVHLLPHLDQRPLYNMFRLDEPWDSDHNKALIPHMPALFKTPGVQDNSKTSIHVFTGPKTPFSGDRGIEQSQITDGQSSTILMVLAGTDKAEVWTKPGGLEVDLSQPKRALGNLKAEFLSLAMFDGTTIFDLPSSIGDKTLSLMIQHADGQSVPFETLRRPNLTTVIPTVIFTLAADVRSDLLPQRLLGHPVDETIQSSTFHHNGKLAVWLPEPQVVVMGSVGNLKDILNRSQTDQATQSPLVALLKRQADFTVSFNLETQESLIRDFSRVHIATGNLLRGLKSFTIGVYAMPREGQPVVEVDFVARDAEKAINLSTGISAWLSTTQETFAQHQLPHNANTSDQKVMAILKDLVARSTVKLQSLSIEFRTPATDQSSRLTAFVAPTLSAERAKWEREHARKSLEQIALAMRRFHDKHGHLPGAGRSAANEPIGLSWRVHLLPFLGEEKLHARFQFDQPWDSEQNKVLIEEIPEVFRCLGVPSGKSPFHVFTCQGALFVDENAPAVGDFNSRLKNTILAAQAGADAAEVWTKPGGLNFNPDDPIQTLGASKNPVIPTVTGNGVVQSMTVPVDARRMFDLIQFCETPVKP